jgi:ABC-type sulfate transport system permease subunit
MKRSFQIFDFRFQIFQSQISNRKSEMARHDPWLVRWGLTLAALVVLAVLVVLPLANVFAQALGEGPRAYWDNLIGDANTRHAILLTMTVTPITVAANLVFAVAAAWAIARFRFPGRTLLVTLIDLPFSVSPGWPGWHLSCSSDCKGTSARGYESTASRSFSPRRD